MAIHIAGVPCHVSFAPGSSHPMEGLAGPLSAKGKECVGKSVLNQHFFGTSQRFILYNVAANKAGEE